MSTFTLTELVGFDWKELFMFTLSLCLYVGVAHIGGIIITNGAVLIVGNILPFFLVDKDECTENPLICGGGTCNNEIGGYRCSCDEGYTPSSDFKMCIGEY